jgi:hypothetical protein
LANVILEQAGGELTEAKALEAGHKLRREILARVAAGELEDDGQEETRATGSSNGS